MNLYYHRSRIPSAVRVVGRVGYAVPVEYVEEDVMVQFVLVVRSALSRPVLFSFPVSVGVHRWNK